jgi:putative peptidoglycan lipid II flippase
VSGGDASAAPINPIPATPPPSEPDASTPAVAARAAASSTRSARLVAAGILLSRIAGLIRERVFAQFFGMSLYADAFRAALRMPNVLQNLLGEGTLSASFIPVYAELLEKGRDEEAGRVAGAVFALLLALAGGLSLIGLLLAPLIVSVFVPGFEGERRSLTIACVRIIFPMTGLLVLSAWALGILNSRRRFFVSYVAPVVWNVAMIATMVFFGARMGQADLVVALAWGALVGGALQLLVQLPWVLSLERQLRVRWDTRLEGVRTAARNAGPAILGRGVVQLSGYVDVFLASVLAEGAVAALGYAQTLYLLPISLFGIAVAAAELPELARGRSGELEALRSRVNGGLRQIAVFVVPSTVGYLVLGDVIVAALYETGDFSAADTLFASVVLAGYAFGLLASTATRLFSSAFFALQDTRTPAKVAVLRVVVAALVGAALMLWLRQYEVRGHSLGALGLSLAAGGAAWIEWALLRRHLRRRIGEVGAGRAFMLKLLGAALAAALVARIVYHVVPDALVPDSDQLRHIVRAGWALVPFAAIYFLGAHALGVPEASALGGRVLRRFRR